jgi:hypothetical protein
MNIVRYKKSFQGFCEKQMWACLILTSVTKFVTNVSIHLAGLSFLSVIPLQRYMIKISKYFEFPNNFLYETNPYHLPCRCSKIPAKNDCNVGVDASVVQGVVQCEGRD